MIAWVPPAWTQDEGAKLVRVKGPKLAGRYVVVFEDDQPAKAVAPQLVLGRSGKVAAVWQRAINGVLLAEVSETDALAIARDPRVAWVEEEGVVSISAGQSSPPAWGLDRVDQRTLPLDDGYRFDFTGAGVTIYVLDTGIRVSHQDFGDRARWGINTIDGFDEDCHGHGTHVAGTAAGTAFGIAKGADLVAVKVLNCVGSGGFGSIISGIEWVTADATPPAVANMSLGGPPSAAIDRAVENSVAAGIFYAVAAGNDNGDACNKSPARTAGALTAGSSTRDDQRSPFSNWGSCVDVFAPGSEIASAWSSGDAATAVLNGTSMASPHVAGVAALVLEQFPALGVDEVRAEITARATPGLFGDPRGAANLLLHSLDSLGNHRLSVAREGRGFGTVTSSPAGIACGVACRDFFAPGTEVTLHAHALPGSSFAGWSTPACPAAGPCTVVLDAPRSITAGFEPIPPLRSLTVAVDGPAGGRVRSSPPGILCGDDCDELFGDGTVVTLTAIPDAGARLASWSAAGCAPAGSCTVTLGAARAVIATFEPVPPSHDLTVVARGASAGRVRSSPAGIDCGAVCAHRFEQGSKVTLIADPAPGASFSGWLGEGCSGTGPCEVTATAPRTVSAYFDPAGATGIAVEIVGTGGGLVSSSPAGITCGARLSQESCSASFPAASRLTLTAFEDFQSRFSGWIGGGCSGTSPCSLTIDAMHLVAARVDGESAQPLSVERDGSGPGTVTSNPAGIECGADCFELFGFGTEVVLTARAAEDSRFSGWSGAGCAGTGTCRVTLDVARAVTATFEDSPAHGLQVTVGGRGAGNVFSDPAGIACGADCQAVFPGGTPVTLTAVPEERSHFVGWDESGCAAESSCELVMDRPRTAAATFGSCLEDLEGSLANWLPIAGPLDGGASSAWTPTASDRRSPARAWWVPDLGRVIDQTLVFSRPVTVTGPNPQLRFWHRFDTEIGADGGVLEYSVDGGVTWLDVTRGIPDDGIPDDARRLLANGYGTTFGTCCSNPLPARDGWSGDSGGWRQVRVDLGDFAGRAVLWRWRMVADAAGAGEGWWLDDVELVGASCVFQEVFSDGFESGDLGRWLFEADASSSPAATE